MCVDSERPDNGAAMWLSRRELERTYEQGKADALTHPVASPTYRGRYYNWAYEAGWRDGIRDLKALKQRLDAVSEAQNGS